MRDHSVGGDDPNLGSYCRRCLCKSLAHRPWPWRESMPIRTMQQQSIPFQRVFYHPSTGWFLLFVKSHQTSMIPSSSTHLFLSPVCHKPIWPLGTSKVPLEGKDKELPAKLASPEIHPLQKASTVSLGWCKLQSFRCLFCSKAFHAHCPLLKIPKATPGPALHEHSRPFSCIRGGFLSFNRSCRRLQTHVFPLFLAYCKSKKLLKQITKDT